MFIFLAEIALSFRQTVNPYQTAHHVASDLDLHFLSVSHWDAQHTSVNIMHEFVLVDM